MARQRTITVEHFNREHGTWRMSISSQSTEALADIAAGIRATAKMHGLTVMNANDPFGDIKARKKRVKKNMEGGNPSSQSGGNPGEQ